MSRSNTISSIFAGSLALVFLFAHCSETKPAEGSSPNSPIELKGPLRHRDLGTDNTNAIYYRISSLKPSHRYRIGVEGIPENSLIQLSDEPDFTPPLRGCDLKAQCSEAAHCFPLASPTGNLYLKVKPAQSQMQPKRFSVVVSSSEPSPEEEKLLHIASPCWEDQVIYFLMLDRFNDGRPENNDQGADEYNPNDERKYSGGDIQGVIDRIDYIQNLGATAIWITPPVANQWWTPSYSGYHGYWARHFRKVDEHYGNLETYKALSDNLHRRGLYLIQDIVTNHTGNFFTYGSSYDSDDPTHNFSLNRASRPVLRPEQRPFHLNNATVRSEREAGIYHWTPSMGVRSSADALTVTRTYQLADLDDLNTRNRRVREALKNSYSYWIKEVGVDGFRVDTVKHVEHSFWVDFFHAKDGIMEAARQTGREDFFPFGEVFEYSPPFSDSGERLLHSYLGKSYRPEFPALLNFPMQGSLRGVLANNQPTSHLAYRLRLLTDRSLFPKPLLSLNFLDNHDIDRFITNTDIQGLAQGLFVLFTIPGIPVIYMGTEQGFRARRKAMFAGGYLGGGGSFNEGFVLYRLIQNLTRLRSGQAALRRGGLRVLFSDENTPGGLVYERTHQSEGSEDSANALIAAVNTSDEHTVNITVPIESSSGTTIRTLFSLLPENTSDARLSAAGELRLLLAPRSGLLIEKTN